MRSATVQHTLPRRARTHEAPPAIPEISATPLLDDSDLPSSPLADAAAKALCTMEISSSSESSESEPDEQMEPVTRRRTRSQLEQETPPSRRRARHACSAGAGVGAAAELQPRAPGVVAAAPIEPCAIHGPVMTAHDESMTSTRDALPQQLPAPAAASEPSAEPAAAGDGESPLQSRARGPLGVLARIFGGERHGSPSSASRSASANALRPDGGASRESSPPARLRGDRRASRLSSGSARGATPAARRPPARPHDDARMDVVDAPEAGGRPSSRSRARGPSPVRRSISGKAQLLRRGGRLSDAPRVPRAPSTVPTVLQWHGEGNDVSVVGSFNAWAERIPMLRSPDHADWYVCLALPPGEFGYRFVVDGQWRHAPEQPLGRPGAGGGGLGEQNGLLHNVVVVADQTEYEREDPCADGADAPRRDGAGEEEEGEEEDDGFSQRVSSSALALLAGKPPAQLPAFLQVRLPPPRRVSPARPRPARLDARARAISPRAPSAPPAPCPPAPVRAGGRRGGRRRRVRTPGPVARRAGSAPAHARPRRRVPHAARAHLRGRHAVRTRGHVRLPDAQAAGQLGRARGGAVRSGGGRAADPGRWAARAQLRHAHPRHEQGEHGRSVQAAHAAARHGLRR